jgi:hypothetical protein
MTWNIYNVPDLEAFLQAALLLPRSITSYFNFPKWFYRGSCVQDGQGSRRDTQPLYSDPPTSRIHGIWEEIHGPDAPISTHPKSQDSLREWSRTIP